VELSGWPWLRLSCLGLYQAVLLRKLGADARLFIGEREQRAALDPNKILAELYERRNAPGLESIAASAYYQRDLWSIVETGGGRLQYLWTAPEVIPPRLLARAAGNSDRRLKLIGAERNWLMPVDDAWERRVLPELRGSESEDLFVYLCGPTLAGELDPAVPALGERSNLGWNLRATRARLNKILPRMPARPAAIELNGCGELETALCVRAGLVDEYVIAAAQGGEVRVLFAVLDDLLARANKLLNSPAVRRALEGGDECLQTQILAGVDQTVSDIINEEFFGPLKPA
jgi:hypothetical protein